VGQQALAQRTLPPYPNSPHSPHPPTARTAPGGGGGGGWWYAGALNETGSAAARIRAACAQRGARPKGVDEGVVRVDGEIERGEERAVREDDVGIGGGDVGVCVVD
jgi:hypothetical protein